MYNIDEHIGYVSPHKIFPAELGSIPDHVYNIFLFEREKMAYLAGFLQVGENLRILGNII